MTSQRNHLHSLSIIDETTKTSKSCIKKAKHHGVRIRKTLVHEEFLKNFFVSNLNQRNDMHLTRYKLVSHHSDQHASSNHHSTNNCEHVNDEHEHDDDQLVISYSQPIHNSIVGNNMHNLNLASNDTSNSVLNDKHVVVQTSSTCAQYVQHEQISPTIIGHFNPPTITTIHEEEETNAHDMTRHASQQQMQHFHDNPNSILSSCSSSSTYLNNQNHTEIQHQQQQIWYFNLILSLLNSNNQ